MRIVMSKFTGASKGETIYINPALVFSIVGAELKGGGTWIHGAGGFAMLVTDDVEQVQATLYYSTEGRSDGL